MPHGTGYPEAGPDGRADTPDRTPAWSLVARVSPRTSVRIDVLDDEGQPAHAFCAFADVDGPRPDTPWTVPLADEAGRFHLIALDLDLARGDVQADLAVLTRILTNLQIPHTVCASGPDGGRHVWLSLVDPMPAADVRNLAYTAGRVLPTLDKSALCNPAAGSVRPPGSPHRHGGRSEVLAAPPGPVLAPTATALQVDAFHEALWSLADDQDAASAPAMTGASTVVVPIDNAGAPHLPGARRDLPPGSRRALESTPADASAALWAILLGAARARWHLADVAALTAYPGMEHLRSKAAGGGRRTRRSPIATSAVLRRQWRRAVAHAAATPPPIGDDATFPARAAAIGDLVDAVQTRADASPGRWALPGGAAARRVLDALCLIALDAVMATVEADVRRLASRTGLGRETVRTQLHQLAAAGWIDLATPAAGRRAHHWKLRQPPPTVGSSPQSDLHSRSQLDPPLGRYTSTRDYWRTLLSRSLHTLAHDLWTSAGLGHTAGRIYQVVAARGWIDVTELATATHIPVSTLRDHLDVLVRRRLLHRDRRRRVRAVQVAAPEKLREKFDRLARKLGAAGVVADRWNRYCRERIVWAWWCDEQEHMSMKWTEPAKRRWFRLSTGQLDLHGRPHGPMPRDRDGRVTLDAVLQVVDAA